MSEATQTVAASQLQHIPNLARLGRERFDYDPSTGLLTWRDPGPAAFQTLKGYRIFKRKFAGRPAGAIKKSSGYVLVCVLGRSILAHRIIWAMVHGYDPIDCIDHRDLCKSNNRIENLREATRSQNSMNIALRADNSSGVKGVHWHKATGKWAAAIRTGGKSSHLGIFPTVEEAAAARQYAARQLHGEFARVA
jgi:hypothetical protein